MNFKDITDWFILLYFYLQGKEFWKRYFEVFCSYVLHWCLTADLPTDGEHFKKGLESAFDLIEAKFIEGNEKMFT